MSRIYDVYRPSRKTVPRSRRIHAVATSGCACGHPKSVFIRSFGLTRHSKFNHERSQGWTCDRTDDLFLGHPGIKHRRLLTGVRTSFQISETGQWPPWPPHGRNAYLCWRRNAVCLLGWRPADSHVLISSPWLSAERIRECSWTFTAPRRWR
jgi:hypothetical protein